MANGPKMDFDTCTKPNMIFILCISVHGVVCFIVFLGFAVCGIHPKELFHTKPLPVQVACVARGIDGTVKIRFTHLPPIIFIYLFPLTFANEHKKNCAHEPKQVFATYSKRTESRSTGCFKECCFLCYCSYTFDNGRTIIIYDSHSYTTHLYS